MLKVYKIPPNSSPAPRSLQLPLSWLALQMESINMVMVARLLTDIGSFTIAFLLALRCVRSLPQDGDEIKESA